MTSTDTTYAESDPLLPRRRREEYTTETTSTTAQVLDEDDDRTTAQRLIILLPCLIILILFIVGASMIDVPLNEVSEAIICRNLFGTVLEPATDPRCKEAPVQAELALISGWELTFGFIPSLLVGVPFGLAADKYGRRAVLLLTCIGAALSSLALIIICRYPETFPLRWRWLAPIFMLIGGGASTLSTIVYTVVADVSTKAYRSTAFLYLATATTAGSLVASPLTYFMMNASGAWFTISLGFMLVVLTIPIAAFVSETRSAAVVKQAQAARTKRNPPTNKHGTLLDVQPILHSTWEQLSLINRTLFAGNPTVGILLSSTVFITVGKSVVIMLLQYVAKRFHWPWAKAGLLIAIKDATSITLTAVVLPLMSQFLLKIGMAPLVKDWWILRVSAIIGVVGSLAMGLAPSIPLFISAMIFAECGVGLQAALRGIITALVDQTHTALMMTVLSMFFTISEMVAGPLMAQMFKVGMDLGGLWVGLPYIASATMLSAGTVLVLLAPTGRRMNPSTAV